MRGTAALAVVAAVASAGAARAGDPPKLKEGLWEIHGQSTENPGDKRSEFTYQICRDHAFDKQANKQLKDVKGCSTTIKDIGGGKFASASTCNVAGITIVSQGLSVFPTNTSTHAETHAIYTPPYNGKTEESMTEDQRYIGKCPAGMKVGDRMIAGGIILHSE